MASVAQQGANPSVAAVTHLSLPVEGMTCASGVGRVERALKEVPGVQTAAVNLATERADITVIGVADPQPAVRAIESAGYTVREETTELAIQDMTCASCVGRVEQALARISGVLEATVNLATERARVRHLAQVVSTADLKAAVRQAGYKSRRLSAETTTARGPDLERGEREVRALRRATLMAAVLTLPIFILEMGSHLIPAMHHWVMGVLGEKTSWTIQFAFTTFVLFGPGLRFFRKGVPALLRVAPDMNSLVSVGTAAAYGYSVVATFAAEVLPKGTANVYFEAAAVIVTLILLGRTLEARARGRTSQAITRLVGLQANTARIEHNGELPGTDDSPQPPRSGVIRDPVALVERALIWADARLTEHPNTMREVVMASPSSPRVIIYTTPTCPDCRLLRIWLDRQAVAVSFFPGRGHRSSIGIPSRIGANAGKDIAMDK